MLANNVGVGVFGKNVDLRMVSLWRFLSREIVNVYALWLASSQLVGSGTGRPRVLPQPSTAKARPGCNCILFFCHSMPQHE